MILLAMHRDYDSGAWDRDGIGALVFGASQTGELHKRIDREIKREAQGTARLDPFEAMLAAAGEPIGGRRRG